MISTHGRFASFPRRSRRNASSATIKERIMNKDQWTDAINGVEMTKNLFIELVSETDHWADVMRHFVPGLGRTWGIGKGPEVLEALKMDRPGEDGDQEGYEISVKVMDAGLGDMDEWVEVTDGAKKLIRYAMVNEDLALKFGRLVEDMFRRKGDLGREISRCILRDLYWNGMYGKTLALRQSAAMRALDVSDIVGEIASFLKSKEEEEVQERMVYCAEGFETTYFFVRKYPTVEWWLAFWNDVPKLQWRLELLKRKQEDFDQDILKAAIQGGAMETTKHIIENDIVNATSMVNHAIAHKRHEIVQYLIDRGEPATNQAVVKALKKRSALCLEVLLKAGGDPNANQGDKSALQFAVWKNSFECVSLLIQSGANPNVTFTNSAERHQETVLKWAVFHGHMDLARNLLELGADVNARPEPYKESALFMVCSVAFQWETRSEWIELLLNAGASVDSPDWRNVTPLMNECYIGNDTIIIQTLLDHGADIHKEDSYHRTVINYVLRFGIYAHDNKTKQDIVYMLLERGLDINVKTCIGTLLCNAIRHFDMDFIRFLLENGADVNIVNYSCHNIMQLAREVTRPERDEILDLLAEYKTPKQQSCSIN